MPKSSKPIKTVAFVSLGCPKNLVDSERMLGLLAEDGLVISSDPANADAIVINTCGFLEASKTESMQEIHDAIAMKKRGKCKRVIVAGCLVQRHKTDLLRDAPQIDRLVGVFDRDHIVEAVKGQSNPRQKHGHFLGRYHDLSMELSKAQGIQSDGQKETKTNRLPVFEDDRGRLRLTPRHYAYLRISEGCNQGCSFCTIPSIRGLMRSKPIEQVLLEARELAADGAVELNLIGQDTTSYGTDIGYSAGLSGLIRTLDKELTDVRWLRLMYAYPSCFTDEMIDALAQADRFVKYIDMPLQHINDEILLKMRRRVSRKQTETLLRKLRKTVPGIAIRTTFISGAPGETDAQHQELVDFIREFGFEMMGVFPYSPEPGTPMGRMDGQVPDAVKQQRVEELMLAQQEVAFEKVAGMVGKTIEVMIDRPQPDSSFAARASFQAPEIDSAVLVEGRDLHAGQFISAKITGAQGYDLLATPAAARGRALPVLSH